jgi:hypothetical protein
MLEAEFSRAQVQDYYGRAPSALQSRLLLPAGAHVLLSQGQGSLQGGAADALKAALAAWA